MNLKINFSDLRYLLAHQRMREDSQTRNENAILRRLVDTIAQRRDMEYNPETGHAWKIKRVERERVEMV